MPKIGHDGKLAIPKEKERLFYYYKRWLWLIFPWACLSVESKMNFSEMIQFCFSDKDKSIRVNEDMQITKRAQMIAVEAKYNKMMILEGKKGDHLLGPVINQGSVRKAPDSAMSQRNRSRIKNKLTERLQLSETQSFRISTHTKMNFTNGMVSTGIDFRTRQESITDGFPPSNKKVFLTGLNNYSVVEQGTEANKGQISSHRRAAKSQMEHYQSEERHSTLKRADFMLTDDKLNIAHQMPDKKYQKALTDQLDGKLRKMNFRGMLTNLRTTFSEKAKNEITLMQKKRNGLLGTLNNIAAKV